mgnify:CR=1 FL=1
MEHTKEKILHTALELFSEKGFDGTSMQDIAGRVGLTKAALYRHFAGKEALFDALIESLRAHYEAGLGAAARRCRGRRRNWWQPVWHRCALPWRIKPLSACGDC